MPGAVRRPTPVSDEVGRAVASLAVRPLVERGTRSGRMLGATSGAMWVVVGGVVLVVVPPGGVRLPNGVVAARWPSTCGGVDGAVRVGSGLIRLGDVTLRPVRWFDPRPRLGRIAPASLVRRLDRLSELVPPVDGGGLSAALVARCAAAPEAAALRLLGRGGGLTPLGDDLLVGVLAADGLLGEAVGASVPGLADRAGRWLIAQARRRTTTLSATLLEHAVSGRVAAPVAGVLHALTGTAELTAAADRLLALGHTSGVALAAGLVIGGRSALVRIGWTT